LNQAATAGHANSADSKVMKRSSRAVRFISTPKILWFFLNFDLDTLSAFLAKPLRRKKITAGHEMAWQRLRQASVRADGMPGEKSEKAKK
jgi:hypothetical protein